MRIIKSYLSLFLIFFLICSYLLHFLNVYIVICNKQVTNATSTPTLNLEGLACWQLEGLVISLCYIARLCIQASLKLPSLKTTFFVNFSRHMSAVLYILTKGALRHPSSYFVYSSNSTLSIASYTRF